MNIAERLKRHIAQMAPHQREREQGKLLIEALAEIEALKAVKPVYIGCDMANWPVKDRKSSDDQSGGG